ncbi:MAG TPA: hypothetical protein VNM66_08145 [Thermodesulfobacteriota bacterium]|nr:hypothetical protein [Thermodesulfobacteriota bacterium]
MTRSIGPDGGTITSTDGRLTLHVPAGALSAPTEISLQPITSTAPHGVAGAWRLGPEGQTFAQPVQLVFRYTEADLAGRAEGGLGAAFQDAQGFWQAVGAVALDASARTLTVSTDHFSDWTLFEWLRLDPASGTVKINRSIALAVVACVQEPDEASLLTPLLPECRPVGAGDEVVLGTPAANGVAGGNAAVGTVRTEGFGVLTYTAPAQKPQANPVAVSIEVEPLLAPLGGMPKVLLVSSVQVVAADTWAGTIATEITQSGVGGEAAHQIHADVTFEFDESTGNYRPTGSLTYDFRIRPPGCESTGSGAGPISPGEGFLAILEFASPPQYLVDGLTTVTVSGTSTCNSGRRPVPFTFPEAIRWGGGSGSVQPDGRTIADTFTISTSREGVTLTHTTRIHLERVD